MSRRSRATKREVTPDPKYGSTEVTKFINNLMVDGNTTGNAKLLDRGRRMVVALTGRSPDEASGLLEAAGGHVKTALVMHAKDVGRAEAQRLLQDAEGNVECVIES